MVSEMNSTVARKMLKEINSPYGKWRYEKKEKFREEE